MLDWLPVLMCGASVTWAKTGKNAGSMSRSGKMVPLARFEPWSLRPLVPTLRFRKPRVCLCKLLRLQRLRKRKTTACTPVCTRPCS